MKLLSGHEVIPLEGEEKEHQQKDFEGYKEGLVRLYPGRWLFPANYSRYADGIYNFKFRSSDAVVMTWPKCGTNWIQEIIWTMRNNPNLDHPLANEEVIVRSPFIDLDMFLPVQKAGKPPTFPFLMEAFQKLCPERDPSDGINLLLAEAVADPRTIKSHLAFSLMPPSMLESCKVVYVARNPKDVIVSYHHHCKIIDVMGYVGTFEDFVQYFVEDDLVYGPYWLHLKEAWERRNHPNLHFIFYEDLKANPLEEIKKLNAFLDTHLTEKQMEDIVEYTSFSQMKSRFSKHYENQGEKESQKEEEGNPTEGDADEGKGFFRKGVVGDWRNRLTPALETKVNQWIQKNLGNFGISFKYGI